MRGDEKRVTGLISHSQVRGSPDTTAGRKIPGEPDPGRRRRAEPADQQGLRGNGDLGEAASQAMGLPIRVGATSDDSLDWIVELWI